MSKTFPALLCVPQREWEAGVVITEESLRAAQAQPLALCDARIAPVWSNWATSSAAWGEIAEIHYARPVLKATLKILFNWWLKARVSFLLW